MKKFVLLLFMMIAMSINMNAEGTPVPIRTHQNPDDELERDRIPINISVTVLYDYNSKILEVWSQDDNIQGEVFVYDENGNVEAYSPCMNMAIHLTSSGNHSILLKGDGWVGEAEF